MISASYSSKIVYFPAVFVDRFFPAIFFPFVAFADEIRADACFVALDEATVFLAARTLFFTPAFELRLVPEAFPVVALDFDDDAFFEEEIFFVAVRAALCFFAPCFFGAGADFTPGFLEAR
jgi:hypothetical protein